MRLTILRNDAQVPPGHLVAVAEAAGVAFDLVRLDEGAALPSPDDVDAVVVLGGEMGAYDTDAYPFLEAEKAFLADLVERGVPVLGLCLGCQLLADALGGEAYLAERPEVEHLPLEMCDPDPIVGILGQRPSLSMHRDTWSVPPGGILIARSSAYNAAFRFGSALGIQPHPEVTFDTATYWLTHPNGVELAEKAGADTEEVLSWVDRHRDESADTADRLFRSWFAEVGLTPAR